MHLCCAACREGFLGFRNKCYKFSTEKKTWNEAITACRNLVGNCDLVKINDVAENDFVTKKASPHNTWIGLNDIKKEGRSTWADGSTAIFTQWGPGEPNDVSDVHGY